MITNEGTKMAKYMVLWKIDTSRTPEDPKTKKAQYRGFGDAVLKQMKEGRIKEWGIFAGETRGFTIFEGSISDLHIHNTVWVPFVELEVHEIMTIDEVNRASEALPE
jgi:hypothetical protein